MTSTHYRDVATRTPLRRNTRAGRAFIAAIGIDRYQAWNQLHNAVSDARGALELFVRLGFEPVGTPLFDELATGDALHHLVTDDLAAMGANDSLVLFFAGHGHTVTRSYDGGTTVKDGYLIPVDGDPADGRAGTWLRLASWLAVIARLPARHILVVLDACHSGLALDPIVRWRGDDVRLTDSLAQLRARRSRRIITSALDDQRAMDGGPVPGHSLFTGCLIEALTGGVVARTGHTVVTGSEIGLYVQRRVSDYPNSAQTPDFGALELDDRGELVVDIAAPHRSPDDRPPPAEPTGPARRRRAVRGAAIGAAVLLAAAITVATAGRHRDDVTAAASSHEATASKPTELAARDAATRDGSAAKKVHWMLRSTPSGARVRDREGHLLGTTPLITERAQQRGSVELVLKHDGYFDRPLSLDGALDADRDEALVPITDKNIPIME